MISTSTALVYYVRGLSLRMIDSSAEFVFEKRFVWGWLSQGWISYRLFTVKSPLWLL